MKKIILGLLTILTTSISFAEPLHIDQINEAFGDLAHMFNHEQKDPIYKLNFLENKKLDYSYDSLKIVDQYLQEVRKTRLDQLSDEQYLRIVVRTGAYVGETIRRNDKSKQWNWVDFENAQKINPQFFNDSDKSLSYAAVLTDGQQFTFPLNKVMKFLNNGEEDSLYSYAILSSQLAKY